MKGSATSAHGWPAEWGVKSWLGRMANLRFSLNIVWRRWAAATVRSGFPGPHRAKSQQHECPVAVADCLGSGEGSARPHATRSLHSRKPGRKAWSIRPGRPAVKTRFAAHVPWLCHAGPKHRGHLTIDGVLTWRARPWKWERGRPLPLFDGAVRSVDVERSGSLPAPRLSARPGSRPSGWSAASGSRLP